MPSVSLIYGKVIKLMKIKQYVTKLRAIIIAKISSKLSIPNEVSTCRSDASNASLCGD